MGQRGENYDVWLEGFTRPTYPKLKKDLEVDTLIIGGGMAGVFSAYLLSKAGHSVALLEKGRLGEWATDCTTASLTQSLDTNYRDLAFIWGEKRAREIAGSHRLAIDLIADIVIEEDIDCDFRYTENHLFARTKGEVKRLKQESLIMKKLGLSAKYKVKPKLKFTALSYLELENQATYQPMKFLTSLAKRAKDRGAKIFEQTEVVAVKKVWDRWLVKAGENKILAKNIVVATYSPWPEPWPLYFKKALYRSYVSEFSAPKNTFTEGLYEDLARPYHYFKIDNFSDRCRIIVGGEDHREDLKIDRAKNYEALVRHTQKILNYPELKFVRKWSGQILEPIDGLPYIGQDKNTGLYRAFGFSGNGLTYSAIAATIFTELLAGQKSPLPALKELYPVNRYPKLKAMLVKGKDFGLIFFGGLIRNILVR